MSETAETPVTVESPEADNPRGRGRPKGSKNRPKPPPELLMPWTDRPEFLLHLLREGSDERNRGNVALMLDQSRTLAYAADGYRLMHDTNAVMQRHSGVRSSHAPARDPEIMNFVSYLLLGQFRPDKLRHESRLLTRDSCWHRIIEEDDDPAQRWAVCVAVNMAGSDAISGKPCFKFVPDSHRYPDLAEPSDGVKVNTVYLEEGHVLLWHPRVLLWHDPQNAWGGGLTAGVFVVDRPEG